MKYYEAEKRTIHVNRKDCVMLLINIFFLWLFILVPHMLFSQGTKKEKSVPLHDTIVEPKNVVFIQLVGESLFMTVNYERKLVKQKIGALSGRIGAGYVPLLGFSSFPITVQETIGKKHCAEIGAGGVFFTTTAYDFNSNQFVKMFFLGYRFQSRRHFILRANLAIAHKSDTNFFIYLPGISIGTRF